MHDLNTTLAQLRIPKRALAVVQQWLPIACDSATLKILEHYLRERLADWQADSTDPASLCWPDLIEQACTDAAWQEPLHAPVLNGMSDLCLALYHANL